VKVNGVDPFALIEPVARVGSPDRPLVPYRPASAMPP